MATTDETTETAEAPERDLDVYHQELVRRARKVGMDVEPERCDYEALAETVAFAEGLEQRVRTALKGEDLSTLVSEQMERAKKPREGLRGKALKRYILEGEDGARQARQAKAEREAKSGRNAPKGPKPGSMTSAMLEVMRPLRTPATAKEVTKKILERKLAPGLKGKTPEATVGAKLSTEAAKPEGLFERVAPGKYQVRRTGKK